MSDTSNRLDDKSGNGNHFTQTTAAARPTLRQSGDLYYIERDGSDDLLFSDTNSTLEAGWTLAAAASDVSGSDTSTQGILTLRASSTSYLMLGMRQSIQEGRSALRGSGASPAVSLTTGQAGSNSYLHTNPSVIVTRFQALSHDIRVNGVTGDTETTTWDAQSVAGAQLFLGSNAGADPIAANIYAVVALKRVPSAAELDKLEAWLAGKAGVTL